VRTRDFNVRARGALVVIIDNGTLFNFSTLGKRRKRSERRMVLRKRKSVDKKASRIVVDK
jgi:hypothetical protein